MDELLQAAVDNHGAAFVNSMLRKVDPNATLVCERCEGAGWVAHGPVGDEGESECPECNR